MVRDRAYLYDGRKPLLIKRQKRFRQENARLVAKNYELEAEIVKLSRIIEENARRDVRIKELEQKNTELEARLASLEQASLIVDRQPQNDNEMISEGLPEVSVPAVDVSEFVVDQQNNVDTKSTEDKIIDDGSYGTPMPEVLPEITDVHDVCRKQTQLEQYKPDSKTDNTVPEVNVSTSPPFCEEDRETDEFLNAVYKKKVSDEIRQRKREKKLQDNSSPEVTSQREPDSETLVASLDSAILLNEKNGQGCSSFPQSEISRDKKNTRFSENSNNSPSSKSCNASSSFECDEKVGKIPYNLKVEQDLRDELSAYMEGKGSASQGGDKIFDIQIPEFSLEAILTGTNKVTSQVIVDLFNIAMKARRKEILCWYCYYKAYEDRVRDVKSKNGIDDKSARTLVYSEIKPLLPDITDVNMRKITFRAKKIYILFDGIGINRIQIISCSASAISNLSDNQIQDIINDFPQKATNTDDVDYDDSVPIWNGHVTSKTNKTKVPVATAPQPTYDRAYFRNKALDQYPNLYREFSSENFDYYGITNETSCPLCKLDHDDEEGIEGRYEARSSKDGLTIFADYLDWHAKLSGLPSVLTDKIQSS